MAQPAADEEGGGTGKRPAYEPEKLSSEAIFATLDRASFGRLATYAPPHEAEPGFSYVVPLQFIHRDGALIIITRPGRKVDNLRAHPSGACMQIDFSEGDGWTSIIAWGNYIEVRNPGERISAVIASFSKYPDRTTRQASSWLRSHTPGTSLLQSERTKRDFVVGRIELTNVSGRYWSGLHVPHDSPLLRGQETVQEERSVPQHLDGASCRALLNSTPLARIASFHQERERLYCLPFWFTLIGTDIWAYHPATDGALIAALRGHPRGVCLQADNLDNRPDADPGRPWRSVLAEGRAEVYNLGDNSTLAPERQQQILGSIRERLRKFNIGSAFTPPTDPTRGHLIRLRIERLSGQATG